MDPLLRIRGLRVGFKRREKHIYPVNGFNLDIYKGETIAIVGESGCGKSLTALSIMGLIGENSPVANSIVNGQIILHTDDHNELELTSMSPKEYERIRGSLISMIFQEPMTALNPLLTVGEQIIEVLTKHKGLSRREAKKQALASLEAIGIPDAANRMKAYPFQLSGGQKQRVMIAIAMACNPKLLIADEPTTALDVTIQSQILYLLKQIKQENNMSIMFITHNLGIVVQFADRVAVMYRGIVVEYATVQQLFTSPQHPYTRMLIGSLPKKGLRSALGDRLEAIQGTVPSPNEIVTGCPFHTRCKEAEERCTRELPNETFIDGTHLVRCLVREEEQQVGAAQHNGQHEKLECLL
ncbi:hypothetical protein BK133_28035 [Paenibacillus sp. FSL H8-0548]|uniref:ABC transporter ATP-binding protein n=1 Tax=Paenibacillus sp. FSL H8-0548 TaxID=1920422 RepID=UPI00096F87FC|nr:ABC transporter ATP-binding protein [Paenibacillus sp. FSL H8-0548]OMF21646.1 hypothetical protein BK133_28035 [Paenibacillus sp. FSL H8-0548]